MVVKTICILLTIHAWFCQYLGVFPIKLIISFRFSILFSKPNNVTVYNLKTDTKLRIIHKWKTLWINESINHSAILKINKNKWEFQLKSTHCFQIEFELRNVGFCGGRKTEVPGEKPSGQGRETTTNLQPTYDTGYEIWTQATFVGGECSHRCAIPALQFVVSSSALSTILDKTSWDTE